MNGHNVKIYEFRRYEKIYSQIYDNERKRIEKFISKNSLIEHIGSTAVHNLSGKGIIDIMISCPKNEINKIKSKLIKIGYIEGSSNEKGRLFLKREAKIKGKFRRFHMHITSLNNKIWKRAIGFRNYLRKNPKMSAKYSELKKKAVIKCNNDGEIYRRLKSKFIEQILKNL